MRLFESVELSNGRAAVWELTVAEVRQLLHQGGEFTLAAVVEACPEAIRFDGSELSQEDYAALWDAFTCHNAAVFEEPKKLARKPDPGKSAKKAARVIDLNCLTFAQAHPNIWSYSYRLYSLLLEETKKAANGR